MRCAVRSSRYYALLTALIALVTTVTSVALGSPASAAAATTLSGTISQAYQHRDGTVSVSGYAFDRAHRATTVSVCLTVNGSCLRVLRPSAPSPTFNAAHDLRGGHRFAVTIRAPRAGAALELRTRSGRVTVLDRAAISTPGARVVAVARQYVGRARYVDGGASPKAGFDCSGYTLFSYRTGGVAGLPHNADAQRYVAHMHRISKAQARPGDLVFYLSGGTAYHVAIYAGGGQQYAAATPQDGIRYQAIWSSAVEFRTDWH